MQSERIRAQKNILTTTPTKNAIHFGTFSLESVENFVGAKQQSLTCLQPEIEYWKRIPSSVRLCFLLFPKSRHKRFWGFRGRDFDLTCRGKPYKKQNFTRIQFYPTLANVSNQETQDNRNKNFLSLHIIALWKHACIHIATSLKDWGNCVCVVINDTFEICEERDWSKWTLEKFSFPCIKNKIEKR